MIYALLCVAVICVDLFTKYLAVEHLAKIYTYPLIQGVFNLTYVENTGVAFGMFKDMRWFFVVVSVLVLVLLAVFFYKTKPRTMWLKIGTCLVFSGAIGNLVDRIVNGYVVDFLDFCLINFPVFNVADISVCVGVVLLMIHYIFFDNKEIAEEVKISKKASDK